MVVVTLLNVKVVGGRDWRRLSELLGGFGVSGLGSSVVEGASLGFVWFDSSAVAAGSLGLVGVGLSSESASSKVCGVTLLTVFRRRVFRDPGNGSSLVPSSGGFRQGAIEVIEAVSVLS